MTNEIFKGHMICDLANHKFVPKRKTIRELWKDDREKPESLPEELDVELGEPDNKGTILVDYDALKAAPGATVNLCSALFAWKAVGHGIQVVTRNKQATAFNLGEGRVYTAGMEGNVVDHIWELANATAADRIAGKGESSDLVEVSPSRLHVAPSCTDDFITGRRRKQPRAPVDHCDGSCSLARRSSARCPGAPAQRPAERSAPS